MARSPRRSPRRRPGRDADLPEIEPIETVEPIESLEPIPSRGGRGGRRGAPARGPAGGGMSIGAKILTITITPIALVAIVFGALILMKADTKAPAAAKQVTDPSADAGGIAAARLLAAPDPDTWDPYSGSRSAIREMIIDHKRKLLLEENPLSDSRNLEGNARLLETFKTEVLDLFLPEDDAEKARVEQLKNRLRDLGRQAGYGRESGFLNAVVRVDKFSRTGKPSPTLELNPAMDFKPTGGGRKVGNTTIFEGKVKGIPARCYEHPIVDWRRQPNGRVRVITLAPTTGAGDAPADAGGSGSVRLLVILSMVLTIGAAVVISLILTSVISTPLKSLVRDIDAVARGETDRQFRTEGGGEISLIARHLEKMTRNLDAMKHAEVQQQTAEAQFSIASQIQENLLPANSPRIEGYEIEALHKPSPDLGTDYHDFLEIDDTHLGIIVADASVKGTTGAMIMSQVRSLIRSFGPDTFSPAEALHEVNSIFAKDLRKGLFVTAVYCVLDLESGVLSVANAGHAPTVFWKLGKRAIARLPGEGLALGLDEGPIFGQKLRDKRVQMEAGDRVLLYTDGAIEAQNSAGEMYGEDSFFELVKRESPKNSAAFVNLVANEIDLFHEGNVQKDDITLVTIRKVR